MTKHEASRTLVKSPPELWAELSDEASLAGHLAEPFGEIRITRLDPETAVAWEGKRASGTVRIEPSGWGTRVTLTARAVQAESPEPEGQPDPPAPEPAPLPPPDPDPLPPAAAEPQPRVTSTAPRRGLRARLLGWFGAKSVDPGPEPVAEPEAEAPHTEAEADSPPVASPHRAQEAAEPVHRAQEAAEPALNADAVLSRILDSLGAAHHRPFSRS
jgi:hypothetical protein